MFERMFALWDCVQRGNSGDKGSSKLRKTDEKVDSGATGGRKKNSTKSLPAEKKAGQASAKAHSPVRTTQLLLSD
jgi:hypothetical protein